MTIEELRREARLLRAWIRDVTVRKQARLREIEAEIKRRTVEGTGKGRSETEGGAGPQAQGAQRVASHIRD